MNLSNKKFILGLFIMLSYTSIGIFGLLEFHHKEMPMVKCPYSQTIDSVCENSIDHVNDWRQFSSAVFLPSIYSFLILAIILFLFVGHDFLNQKRYFYNWKYYLYHDKKSFSFTEEINKWLSLFENSPSFSYVKAH